MTLALGKLSEKKELKDFPIHDFLAATSVGIDPELGEILDLNYIEDSKANVDMNIVMTGNGEFVELQGTGEEATFSSKQLQALLSLGEKGVKEIIEMQKAVLGALADQVLEGSKVK